MTIRCRHRTFHWIKFNIGGEGIFIVGIITLLPIIITLLPIIITADLLTNCGAAAIGWWLRGSIAWVLEGGIIIWFDTNDDVCRICWLLLMAFSTTNNSAAAITAAAIIVRRSCCCFAMSFRHEGSCHWVERHGGSMAMNWMLGGIRVRKMLNSHVGAWFEGRYVFPLISTLLLS